MQKIKKTFMYYVLFYITKVCLPIFNLCEKLTEYKNKKSIEYDKIMNEIAHKIMNGN
jgi:hypothetical protein